VTQSVKPKQNAWRRWLIVAVFAAAMAWVESAVVFYLRTMINRIEPYQPHPLPLIGGLGLAELVREAATLIMLLMVGILAGRTWRSRLGYFAIAFGVWDIFYYIFLKLLCGWPHSVLDWDILFLLPLPWWGPVLAPMSIALLMILWGTVVNSTPTQGTTCSAERKAWVVNIFGVALALYVFMNDAIGVIGNGANAVRNVLPTRFNWPLFALALTLLAAPIVEKLVLLRRRNSSLLSNPSTKVHHETLAELL